MRTSTCNHTASSSKLKKYFPCLAACLYWALCHRCPPSYPLVDLASHPSSWVCPLSLRHSIVLPFQITSLFVFPDFPCVILHFLWNILSLTTAGTVNDSKKKRASGCVLEMHISQVITLFSCDAQRVKNRRDIEILSKEGKKSENTES